MFDDLARAQRPSALEWLVVNVLIPSVLVTFVLQWPHAPPAQPQPDNIRCPATLLSEALPPLEPMPDVFPQLIRMPQAVYPEFMRRAGIEDRLVLLALVNSRGRVDSASILIVRATNGAFALSARRALSSALFRPGIFGSMPMAAWLTIQIDFTLTREAT